MFKNLRCAIISLVFLLFSVSAIAQQLSSFIIGIRAVQRYNRTIQSSIGVKVYNAVMDKRIPAYKDSALKEKWDKNLLFKSLRYCDTIQVPTSEMGCWTRDTVVYTNPDPRGFNDMRLFMANDETSIFFSSFYDSSHKQGYFVSLTDIKPMLTTEEQCLMEHFLEPQNLKGQIFDFNGLIMFSESLLGRIGFTLYTIGLNGKASAYWNDSLTKPQSPDIINKIGAYVENVPTKEDKDSIVVTPFNPAAVKGICVVNESKTEALTSTFKSTAIGPCYEPMINGVVLSVQPMFYMRLDKNLMSVLSATDMEYLIGLINFCRLHKIDPYNYMDDHDSVDRNKDDNDK